MKFTKIGTLMVVLLAMFLVSCGHTNQEESAPNFIALSSRAANERQIAYVTYGTDPDAEKWFTYDAAGQLIRAGAYIDTIFFTYKRDSIVKYYADKNNHWDASIGYALDKNGRVISSSIRDADYNEISNYRFVYDGNGYLVRTSQQLASNGNTFVNQFAYIGGNLTEIKCFNADGKLSSRYLYEYYPDKVNDLNLFLHSITDDYFTHERLGKKNANLIKSLTNVSVEGDTLSHVTYAYRDEHSSRQLTEIETDVLNENRTEIHYHFIH